MNKIRFTKEGYEKLQKEHHELHHIKRAQAVDRLQSARNMGDLSENSEYTAAKDDLEFITQRIQELEKLLQSAEIIAENTSEDIVDIGYRVKVDINGKIDEFIIVGEFESDPMNKKLSTTSPIGKALVGKKKGEHAEVEVPAGKLKYKIVDIQKS